MAETADEDLPEFEGIGEGEDEAADETADDPNLERSSRLKWTMLLRSLLRPRPKASEADPFSRGPQGQAL